MHGMLVAIRTEHFDDFLRKALQDHGWPHAQPRLKFHGRIQPAHLVQVSGMQVDLVRHCHRLGIPWPGGLLHVQQHLAQHGIMHEGHSVNKPGSGDRALDPLASP